MTPTRTPRFARATRALRLAGILLALVGSVAAADAAAAKKSTSAKKPTEKAAENKPAVPEPEKTLRSAIQAGTLDELHWPDFADLRTDLAALYDSAGYQMLWIEDGAPTAAARALVARLAEADSLGLDPTDYDAPWLATQQRRLVTGGSFRHLANAARYDLGLTVAALRYTTALHRGRVDPRAAGAELGEREDAWSARDVVRALFDVDRQVETLRAVEPDYEHYRSLVRALAQYRALAKGPELGRELPVPENLKPGEPLESPARLRALLEATGDLAPLPPAPAPKKKKKSKKDPPPPPVDPPAVYSEDLVDGVQRFQRRHGLLPDGILWPQTLEQMRRPFEERAHQIGLALERWRWLPPAPSVPPVVVNIPAFQLYAPLEPPDREANGLAMDVLVGAAGSSPTPVFVSEMKYVVFRPYWELPLDIMLYEFGPRADWDAENLERRGFVLVEESDPDGRRLPLTPSNLARLGKGLRMRQLPGENNALGLVKFMFPNSYDVYLHDTSVPGLFAFTRRDMSHGCIRVSEPAKLAAHVLRDIPGWSEDRATAAMQGSADNVRVDLPQPVPVFILYVTAEATEKGEARFYADVYGLDKELDELLKRGYPYPKAATKAQKRLAQGRISTEVPSGMTR